MKVILILFTLLMVLPYAGKAQQLQQIPHCPSKEIYDMMFDKKGYLWIAHSMGICRYDGVNFTSFTNPEQSAVGMSGLLEDNYGRIWFHNFNGQVFYIKDEKMVYFKQYGFKATISVMEMALAGDSLFITSLKGLFICNTKTLKYDVRPPIGETLQTGIFSFCITGNKVLALSPIFFCSNNRQTGLIKIPPQNVHDSILQKFSHARVLPHAIGDTILLVDYDKGVICGIKFYNNQLFKIFENHLNTHINTVTASNSKIWVNTGKYSFALFGTDTIKGYNLTNIIQNANNNNWYSSLTEGLFTSSKKTRWENVTIKQLDNADNVRCFLYNSGHLILASQQGKLLIQAKGAPKIYVLNNANTFAGAVENIQQADSTHYFIETSKQLFLLDITKLNLLLLDPHSVKQVVVTNKILYLASPDGVTLEDAKVINLKSTNTAQGRFTIDDTCLFEHEGILFLNKSLRCRALIFDNSTNSLLISFNDGLQALHNNKLSFILYNGQPLNVSSFAAYNNKIYAATFNKGLFVIKNGTAIKIINDIESPLDAIVKIKCCNNHLWVFRTHDIQLLDTRLDKFIAPPPLPTDASDISDVEEDSTNIYLATYHGMYTMPITGNAGIDKVDITLRYMLVNNADTVCTENALLENNKNNLLFKLAVPVYDEAEKLHFKYSLNTGGNDTAWYYTQDAQRDIQFNALKPGDYTLEVIAVKDGEVISSAPMVYQFAIKQPWYNTWWFYVTIVLIIVSGTIAIQQYRLKQLLKIEGVRRKIATDLHDDIGSTLSSINVYSELAKKDDDNKEYINTIQQSTVSIINNLDDLVWNINPRNDVLENMLTRMRLFAEPLLTEQHIECVFTTTIENPQFTVDPHLRTNIYLLFKEMVNNVVKHAASTVCTIDITQKGKIFILSVNDNGRGFDSNLINRHRNGLHNMQQRVKDIKGSITINSAPGQGTEIKISCLLK